MLVLAICQGSKSLLGLRGDSEIDQSNSTRSMKEEEEYVLGLRHRHLLDLAISFKHIIELLLIAIVRKILHDDDLITTSDLMAMRSFLEQSRRRKEVNTSSRSRSTPFCL